MKIMLDTTGTSKGTSNSGVPNQGQNKTLPPKLIKTALLASALLLGLTSEANTDQIDYNKYEMDSTVQDMMWCGKDNEVILVQTLKGSVYRSRDRGSSWKKL